MIFDSPTGKPSSPHKVTSTTSEPSFASANDVPGPSSSANNNNRGKGPVESQSMTFLYVSTLRLKTATGLRV